ncbi:signal peptide peptidase SppA [Sphingomonas sp. AR_OL41]|uniref:signal peptide peptidase SppA n=1 Tax=Sphingomonas sp. AR_OL41 TaxID=3042729 RepID=UPI00247FF351|nr:signal peptide peptidase SppA [Sphingomonas sp. AR_OL41]MDH7972687.1 signal peptide peptidase SppA [Sphingomonas sp. AR_OL41]
MKLVRGAWKILVGIKDGLVLIAMLIFFGLLFAALSAKPGPTSVRDGALVLQLDGRIVEHPADVNPFAALSGGGNDAREFRLRDVVRALDKAKDDTKVKVVVLDLESFGGGYPAALNEVADAIGRVRASGKPVLAYATSYTDGAYRLAANASEIWESPMAGSLFMGPGGSQLYYKGLIDKLGVNAHVYRVGKYKSYVEPYTRPDASPEAKEEVRVLYDVLFAQWKEAIGKARPKAKIVDFLAQPDKVVLAAQGDIARANLNAGIVDKLGTRLDFGKRVAAIAGHDDRKAAGSYNTIRYQAYVDANPLPTGGDAIGVLTIAGDIVDGKSNGGSVGSDTVAKAVLDALAKKKLKALVVRVDSPGGSALASEDMRMAIVEARAQKLPIVISMGSVAASGGYWVSTAGDVIFAEPTTITGSIGIFGIIPTFENTLKKIGVTTDGVKTTPISGQPDIMGGTNKETDAIFQAGIENGYRQFVTRVAQARHLTPARVDEIGQGRVWDGGTAHQLGLVDRFGGLQDAIAEAAKRAGLKVEDVHAEYLEKKPGRWATLLAGLFRDDDDEDSATPASDAYSRIATERRAMFASALGEVKRIGTGAAVQARCLECSGLGGAAPSNADVSLMNLLLARLGW